MRTRRQTELSEVVRVRQAGQNQASKKQGKKTKKTESGGSLEGPKVSVI